MSIRFNADEVLKIAEKIEGNGAAFYRKAAQLFPAAHNKDFLLRLAEMEDDHQKTFSAMRAALKDSEKESTAYDPMDESLLYLKTLADQHGGEGTAAVADALSGQESMEKILLTAIELEKKSILFYLGIIDLVAAAAGKDKIGRIIDEEKGHVVILSKELNAVRKA